ncbi:NHLP family bacteriocin export ABC transporter peptidase/permease/ATPase subunit [Streptomyces chartreusis]|uniref:NHLP family bacteriocin export ABC transporter peptidase/permease/ATPase subunit n=1 Tax=Streptomyces chartreusis TaxID=1969 RepID=UPI00367BBC3C
MTQTLTPHDRGQSQQTPSPADKPEVSFLRRRHVRTPTVLQLEAVECGAASLSMVLAYYKRYLPLEDLRVRCGVSRDGSRAGHIVKAARELGLVAAGKRMGVSSLGQLQAPAILFWEFNHYVVWEGFGRRLGRPVVYLNDPAQGRRVLTMEEFSDGFTGVVLTMHPGPDFRRGGEQPKLLRRLPERLRHSGGALAIALFVSLMLVLVSTMLPAFTRGFIDLILPVPGGSSAVFFIAMAAAVVLAAVLAWMQQAYLSRVQLATSTLSSGRHLRHLLRLPISFFDMRAPADIAQRLSTNDTVSQVLTTNSTLAVTNALVVVGYAALLWSYDPALAVIGVSIMLLHIGLLHIAVRMRAQGVAKLRVDRAQLMSTSYSGIRLIESMKATGGERGFFRRWGAHHAALLSQQQATAAPAAMLSSVGPLLTIANAAIILLFGGLRAIEGQLSIGLLIAFQVTLNSMSRPLGDLMRLAPQFQDAMADVARLVDVESSPADVVFDRPESELSERLVGRIEFRSVTFGYARLAKPLLTDFSFRLEPGNQVAIVGGTGSGKSTVSKLLAGLQTPWAGEILIDGTPHQQVPRSVLTASVAFVDQDIFMFEGSVRDNVALWDPTISDEAVLAALRDACLDDVIAGRPGGIYSRVDQDGRNFSGGQRQRLEIARALARRPSVLVLDEATSALDAETEHRISENLRRRGCACLIIAHRLSTIRSSDEIIVLDAGQVVERGTHDELLHAEGRYSSLAEESK